MTIDHHPTITHAEARRMSVALKDWLADQNFTHFVTLATNRADLSPEQMKHLLKCWDARISRALCGRNYRRMHEHRPRWIAVLEKPEGNPHWHLLMKMDDHHIERLGRKAWPRTFDEHARLNWSYLVRSGSVDVQQIYAAPVYDYVAKELVWPTAWHHMTLCTEFWNN